MTYLVQGWGGDAKDVFNEQVYGLHFLRLSPSSD